MPEQIVIRESAQKNDMETAVISLLCSCNDNEVLG